MMISFFSCATMLHLFENRDEKMMIFAGDYEVMMNFDGFSRRHHKFFCCRQHDYCYYYCLRDFQYFVFSTRVKVNVEKNRDGSTKV